MFRKPDQDLFARVFDEGGTGDAGMEWLRDGLKDLRDVPAHGLSNERLRDRVLGTGLAPVKSTTVPWWSWAWAPVAAAAIAVVILPRLRSNPDPTVILNPAQVDSTRIAMNETKLPSSVPTLDPSRLGTPAVASSEGFDIEAAIAAAAQLPDIVDRTSTPVSRPSITRSNPRSSVSARPKSNARPIRASVRVAVASLSAYGKVGSDQEGPGMSASAVKPQETPSTMAFTAAPMARLAREGASLVSESSDPLVVLAPEIDASTGAATATEVDSPANLSIGG